MEIKAIRTEADYLAALQEVSVLVDLDPAYESPEGEQLEVMRTLVQAYEAKRSSLGAAKSGLEQGGVAGAELPPRLMNIDVSLLDDYPEHYRLIYPEDGIRKLAALLKRGQTTPIRVRPKPNGRFEIINGHRRKRAAIVAELTQLCAVVVQVDDLTAAIQNLVDNESQRRSTYQERAIWIEGLKTKLA
jgi:hypothetical protein